METILDEELMKGKHIVYIIVILGLYQHFAGNIILFYLLQTVTEMKKHMNIIRQVALFGFVLALLDLIWQMPACAVLVTLSGILIGEFTGGEVDSRGRFGHELEKPRRCPLPPACSCLGLG